MGSLSSFGSRIAAAVLVSVALMPAPARAAGPAANEAASEWKGPRIFLSESQSLVARHIGSDSVMSELASGSTQPLSLASGDLDEDGINDLLVGYGTANGGVIAFYRGNLDAFAPQSRKSFDDIAAGRYPSPFLEDVRTFDVPVRPDFIAVGNFTGSGHVDLIAASRDANRLAIFPGNANGSFGNPRILELPGAITTLAAGAFGSPGLYTTLLIGVTGPRGPAIEVERGSNEGLVPVGSIPIEARVSSIEIGRLEGMPSGDAAIVAGGGVFILHGANRELEHIALPDPVAALTIGAFLFDRNSGHQLAVLTASGDVGIVVRSDFDPRPLSVEEVQAKRRALANGVGIAATATRAPGAAHAWKIIERFPGMASSDPKAPAARLIRTRVTMNGADDLMLLGAAGQLKVVSHPEPAETDKAFRPGRVSLRSYTGSPIATMSVRVGVHEREGIISLEQGKAHPSIIAPLAATTINVNDTTDTIHSPGCATTAVQPCSIRDAILYNNVPANAGSTIMIPGGTYTLSRARVANDYSGTNGALYVLQNVTIVGAGQASTFIQGGPSAGNGVDMVIAVNEDINPLSDATGSISNLTIRFGTNRGAHGADGDGGAMEFDTGTSGNANLTLTNVTISDSNTLQGNGGGIAIFNFTYPAAHMNARGTGFATLTNCTFQNNTVKDTVGGVATAGGVWVSDPARMVMTNGTVINNLATFGFGSGGGITITSAGINSEQTVIHNSTISGNQSSSLGGGIRDTSNLIIDQSSIISGNSTAGIPAAAPNPTGGGGIWYGATLPDTMTLSHVTITGNSAPGASGALKASGGAIFSGSGSGGCGYTVQFSRLAGNTAADGVSNNVYEFQAFTAGNPGNQVTALHNWWGTNVPASTISGAAGCPAVPPNNAVCSTPFVILTNAASPTTINTTQSTTLTASLAKESDGSASDVTVLTGVGVTWGNPVRGSLSAQVATIQANGKATATLTQNGTCGTTSADATVDQQGVTASATVVCPDLVGTKTNNVGGTTIFPSPWTWTIHVANQGAGFAPFANGNTILSDNLPNANATYGAVSLLNQTGITGTISCGIASNNLACTASGAVQIAVSGSFDVQFTATPTAAGTFANPRAGGSASVNPNNDIGESNTANNSFANSVLVTEPDLTLSQTNSVGGATTLGNNWIWTLTVSNAGNGAASFANTQTILSDNLPNTNIGYSSATPGTFTSITNSGNISCSITTSNLVCTATGPVTIGAGGSFKVTLTATPSAIGTFTNPRGGGAASVDPGNVVIESNEANNSINSDAVVVTAPDLTLTKADSAGNATTLGNSWNWTLTIANGGNAPASFTSGQAIVSDNLANSNITYGTPSPGTFTSITNSGSISCSINASKDLTCTASGATVTIAAGGSFVVTIPSTPTAIGTFANPRSGGSATVDPGNVIAESNEANNSANSDSVVVTAPDLTLTKSNNAGGTTTLGNNWTWTLTVSNAGNAAANFANTQTILTDNLPNANLTYGAPAAGSFTAITGSANISCAIATSNLTCSATGAVTIGVGGSFQVTVLATPTSPGTFANPRAGGIAKVDPSSVITESDETNNTSADTVIVTGPDLTLTKANDVGGTTTLGGSWNWTLTAANGGSASATFTAGQTIVLDNLPASNLTYGSVSTSNLTNVSGTGTISCSINGTSDLSCTASGGTVIIGTGGSFKMTFSATPSAIGAFVNPRAAGTAKVDPNNNIAESDETNNTATNTVTVTAPDLTLTKSDSVGNATTLGNNWTWTLHVANAGNAAATFADTNTIVSDNLPNANIAYGAVSIANKVGTAGTIACAIAANDLTCTASGVVTIATGGSFDIQFVATPSTIGAFANPRSGGNATVDPLNVIVESNEGNNTATDTVTVTAPDLTLTKSNNVTNATALGNSWTWTLTVTNGGNAPAVFASTNTILTDNLPNSSINYGSPTPGTFTGVTGSVNISCSITGSDLTCSASGGAVTLGAGGSFQVTFLATPSAIGTFANPRSGGATSVDPANVIVESNEANNTASNSVVVTAPDLTLTKSNNAPSPAVIGNAFTWTLHVANAGNSAAGWSTGQTIVADNLPNANMVYGAPSVANAAGVTGTVACSINGTFDLSCLASGGAVSLAAGGSFDVQFTATPSVAATYVNPRAGGSAKADPNNNVVESNEANNTASNSLVVLAGADLSLSKSGPGSAIAGDPNGFDYTFTVTNHGPIDNTGGFTVNDTLAAGLTFSSVGSSGSCAPSGQVVTCTNTTGLVNGAQQSFTVHVVLASSSSGTISNTASVTSTGTPDPVSANNTSTAVMTTVVAQADLSITKSAPATVVAGNAFDYTIVVTNNGPSDNSGGFTVTDTLPGGTTFQAAGSDTACSAAAQNVTCTIATGLINGATRSITLHVSVASTAVAGSVLSNTATVTSGGTIDPSSGNNGSAPATTTTVQTAADLSITTSAPATAIAGTMFDLTLTITNNGPSDDAGGLTTTTVLPGGLTFQTTGSSAGCTASGQTVTCTSNTSLAPNATRALTVRVLLASTVAAGTDLADASSVSANGVSDPVAANDTSPTVHTTVQAAADLAITKSAPATAIAGSTFDYTLTVTNSGPSANSGGFTVTDVLPVGTSFQPIGSSSGCTASSQTVTCTTIGGLLVGGSASYTIHVAVSPAVSEGTVLHNTASITAASTTDPNKANDTSATLDTTVHANADLAVTKSVPPLAVLGQPLAYTITVTNNGPSDAQSVSLSDVVPSNTSFVSMTQATGPVFSCGTPTVTCTIATLPAAASASFTLTVNVNGAGNVVNTATVTSATTDPNGANNSATATTTAAKVDLAITKSVSPGLHVVGLPVTYSLVVTNQGAVPATSVVVTDPLPGGMTATATTPPGACSGTTTVTCTASTLAAGASITYTITANLPQVTGNLTNTATVSCASTEATPADNSGSAQVTVLPLSAIPTLGPEALALLAALLAIVAMTARPR